MRLRPKMTLDRLSRSPSRVFLVLTGSFLFGVALGALWERPVGGLSGLPAAIAVGVLLAAALSRAGRRAVLVAAALACATVGFWRCLSALESSAYVQPEVSAVVDIRNFEGTVVTEPQFRSDGLVSFDIDQVVACDGDGSVLPRARLYVRSPLRYLRGDRLAWECRPRVVSELGRSGFDDRLLLDGVRWTCSVYRLPEVLSSGHSAAWSEALSGLRRAVVRSVERVFPEPESSFLLGLLVGIRDGLPSELADGFRDAGLSHVLAVSGYNVAQLISVGVLLLGLMLVPRRRSVTVMAAAVLVFAGLVGGDASVVRAAIMGCVGILATLQRRRYSGVRSLLAVAALMLALNPLVLRHDVGFQLSFAAVWGLHGLAPHLLNLLPVGWRRNWLARTASETTAATLATLPIVLKAFGRLPAVGLLANLAVLPIIPWAMLFGTLAATVGTVSLPLALVPGVVAAWLMRTAEWLAITSLAVCPYALELEVGPTVVVLLYLWLALLWFALRGRSERLCRER